MRRLLWLAQGAVLAAILVGPAAGAFVTFSSKPAERREPLRDYYVWNNNVGSLMGDRRRGLGGGLEYSVTPNLCTQLLPKFRDSPRPTCGDLYHAIDAGMARWTVRQPAITFHNVSSEAAVSLVPGNGAEIDVLVMPLEWPAPAGSAAWTKVYEVEFMTRRTYSSTAGMAQIQSADIVISNATGLCFFLDAGHPRSGCNHFPSLIIHETGHALGLDHPDQFPALNVDSDQDPSTPIEVDCKDPRTGLTGGAPIAPDAVMRASEGQPVAVRLALTPDDLGGRDFLYPPCGAIPQDVGPLVERPSPPQTTFPVPAKTADGCWALGTGLATALAGVLTHRGQRR